MGIGVEDLFGTGQHDFAEKIEDMFLGMLFRFSGVQQDLFHDLVAAAQHGVKGSHGFLENHRNATPTNMLQLFFRGFQQVDGLFFPLFGKKDLSFGISGYFGVEQPHHRQGGHGLSGARLPDNAECSALVQIHVHLMENGLPSRVLPQFEGQIRYFQQLFHRDCKCT